jgi:hypothetical protein
MNADSLTIPASTKKHAKVGVQEDTHSMQGEKRTHTATPDDIVSVSTACSFCWFIVAESTVRWFIVREKHCWITADLAE